MERVHASAPLVCVGFSATALGATGCSFWHHVAMQAGPNITVSGALVLLLELRRMNRVDLLILCVMVLGTFFIPMHVH